MPFLTKVTVCVIMSGMVYIKDPLDANSKAHIVVAVDFLFRLNGPLQYVSHNIAVNKMC